ncbi:phage tail tip lysozyme [Methylobacterium sp. J-001]|uniref:phage tail tip lysozyme n=1 Tax=Methylobacterium sp. J-001 TaxID=2836609 RepID=UPI002444DCA1|nr:phage tail tip lysozyme [Methylobacterium sp. J-001]
MAHNENAQTITGELRKAGYNDNIVAAMVGSMQTESTFNPRASNDQSGGHTGLWQWDKNRWPKVAKWIKDQGGDLYDARWQTHDGRSLRILTLIDEHSRACLALKVARRINSLGVIEALAEAMCLHGIPENIRCDNGPEMIAKALRKWVAKTGPQIQYIAPGSPWENGYCESFNGKLRDECLRQEIFYSLKEAQIVIGLWQNTYNRVRPHASLGYRPPSPLSFLDLAFRLPTGATMQ